MRTDSVMTTAREFYTHTIQDQIPVALRRGVSLATP